MNTFTVSLHGAELQSRQKDGKEYPIGNCDIIRQPMPSHDLDSGYLTELPAPVPMPVDEDGLLPIIAETFSVDTFMLEHNSVKSVALLDKDKQPYLKVGSDQTKAYDLCPPPTNQAAPSFASSPGAGLPTWGSLTANSPCAT